MNHAGVCTGIESVSPGGAIARTLYCAQCDVTVDDLSELGGEVLDEIERFVRESKPI